MAYVLTFIILSISAMLTGNAFGSGDPMAMPAILLICLLLSWPISAWISNSRDTFDPVCLMAIFGVHFFLLGPLYQLSNGYFPYLQWNSTLQSYSTVWFYLQAAFLTLTFIAVDFGRQPQQLPVLEDASIRKIEIRARHVLWAVAITFAVKLATFYYFGGVAGVVGAYETRLTYGVIENNPFSGLGPLVLVGDMFPIALGIYAIATWRTKRWFSSNSGLALFLVALLAITLASVGLRGSRSSVVFAMAVVVLSYHFLVKPLTRTHLVFGAVGLLAFMQGYLAYKFGGLDALFSDTARQQSFAARQLDDGPEFVLIRDFTRMDVQTIALYRILEGGYPLSWGRSLLSGATAVIPTFLFPARPLTFILEKTEIINAARSFDPRLATTLVFGGIGEIFVNFGWLSLGLAWPFGRLLRKLQHTVIAARHQDASALLAPIACLLPIALLVYDSNSLAYFLIQFCAVSVYLFLILKRIEKRKSRREAIEAGAQSVFRSNGRKIGPNHARCT